MQLIRRTLLGILSAFGLACGGSPTAHIHVRIASNQTGNPLLQIDADRAKGLSAGISFNFDLVNCNATFIGDTVGAAIWFPPQNEGGFSATQSSYSIPSSLLDPRLYYRVTMVARAIDGSVTHTGVADCPIRLANEQTATATLCFGKSAALSAPICPGLRSWTECPGVTNGILTCG